MIVAMNSRSKTRQMMEYVIGVGWFLARREFIDTKRVRVYQWVCDSIFTDYS